MIITAYRITQADFAASIWSGAGARDYGGRWNSKGVAVVYTAENRSLAAIEQLVHLIKPRVLRGFVIASIRFEASQVQRIHSSHLPPNWRRPVAPRALRRIGDDFFARGRYPVLAVPSVVMSDEWNYLLNPNHPEFAGFKKSRPERFVFDPRLK